MTVTIWEHFLLFAVVSLFLSLVYNGLRQESVKTAIFLGLRRFVWFMLAGGILAAGTYLLARNL